MIHFVSFTFDRYKVEMYVVDGDSKYRFFFWDGDCVAIIGKTIDDMRKKIFEVKILLYQLK